MKRLILLDFDQSLIFKNSFFHILRNIASPLTLVQCGLQSLLENGIKGFKKPYRHNALFHALSGEKISVINSKIDEFINLQTGNKLRLNGRVLSLIDQLKKDSDITVVIVTGSPDHWVKKITASLGFNHDEILGSTLEKSGEYYTGLYTQEECIGGEKVRRIRKYLDQEKTTFDEIIAIGNLPDDEAMILMADRGYAVSKHDGHLDPVL